MQQRIPTHCLDMMPYKFLKQAQYDDCLITIICNLDQVCTFDSMLLFYALTEIKIYRHGTCYLQTELKYVFA